MVEVEAETSPSAKLVQPSSTTTGKRRCTKCRKPGHRADRCTAGVDEPEQPARVETAAKKRRADIIAKRAGAMPTPVASFEMDED